MSDALAKRWIKIWLRNIYSAKRHTLANSRLFPRTPISISLFAGLNYASHAPLAPSHSLFFRIHATGMLGMQTPATLFLS